MSTLVQKKNKPLEEMAEKADKMENQLQEKIEENVKLSEQVQRLQEINGSVQKMFENKIDNIKLGYDLHVERLEKKVKQQEEDNKKLVEDQKENSAASSEIADLKEMIKMSEENAESKTKELLEMKMQVEEMSMAIMERDMKV